MSLRRGALLLMAAGILVPLAAGAGTTRPVDIGRQAPRFEAVSIQGEAVLLETAIREHKAVVVLFTSAVCPYANYFAAYVREMSESYGPRGALFVGVNSNNWESLRDIVENTAEHRFTFPILRDERHVIADRFGASRTPEAFLVDATGRLRYRGWVKSKQESPDLQRALDDVLGGRPVRRPVTKAFGCAVDRF